MHVHSLEREREYIPKSNTTKSLHASKQEVEDGAAHVVYIVSLIYLVIQTGGNTKVSINIAIRSPDEILLERPRAVVHALSGAESLDEIAFVGAAGYADDLP